MRREEASQPDLSGAGGGGLRYGITDRLTWAVAALGFAYRFGEPGHVEVIPFGRLTQWGAGYSSVEGTMLLAQLEAGAAVRLWLGGTDTSVIPDGSVRSEAHWSARPIEDRRGRHGPTTWCAIATVGMSHRVSDRVTLHAGLRTTTRPIAPGTWEANDTRGRAEARSVRCRTSPCDGCRSWSSA